MKKILLGVVFILLALSAFAQLTGSSTGTIGYDIEGVAPVYSLETGVAYTAGIFNIGANANTSTFTDVTVDMPVGIVTDHFSAEVTPAVIISEASDFNFDVSLGASFSIISLSYDIGYGLDEVLNMGAGIAVAPADFMTISIDLVDADDIIGGTVGDVVLTAAFTY